MAEKEIILLEEKLRNELKRKSQGAIGGNQFLEAQHREQSGPSNKNNLVPPVPIESNLFVNPSSKTYHTIQKSQHFNEKRDLRNSNQIPSIGIKDDYQRLQKIIKGQMKKSNKISKYNLY